MLEVTRVQLQPSKEGYQLRGLADTGIVYVESDIDPDSKICWSWIWSPNLMYKVN